MNVLVLGATAQVVPTVAFQVREGERYRRTAGMVKADVAAVRKEGVRLKIWDVAGVLYSQLMPSSNLRSGRPTKVSKPLGEVLLRKQRYCVSRLSVTLP